LHDDMASRPHLQASGEWKLFQGELLLFPLQVHEFVDLAALLPPTSSPSPSSAQSPSSTSDAPAASSSALSSATTAESSASAASIALAERAVAYFDVAHHELARLPLNESNVRRQWYSPLVYALLQASEAQSAGAGSSVSPSTQRALALLSQALRFVESSVSSDPSHPYLLRVLSSLAVLSHARLSDPIQSEGLLRTVIQRMEASLSGGGTQVQASADAQRFLALVDALSEQAALLARLEWNATSRAPEARAIWFRIVAIIRRDKDAKAMLQRAEAQGDTKRALQLPLDNTDEDRNKLAALTVSDLLPDPAAALPLRTSPPVPLLPEWLADKLRVGSGVGGR